MRPKDKRTPSLEYLESRLEDFYFVPTSVLFLVTLICFLILLYERHMPPSGWRDAIKGVVGFFMVAFAYVGSWRGCRWKDGIIPWISDNQENTMHGCHNRKDAAKSYLVQDGWTGDGRRIMKEHADIFAVNGMPCKYKNEHPDDKACRGCRHGAQAVRGKD